MRPSSVRANETSDDAFGVIERLLGELLQRQFGIGRRGLLFHAHTHAHRRHVRHGQFDDGLAGAVGIEACVLSDFETAGEHGRRRQDCRHGQYSAHPILLTC